MGTDLVTDTLESLISNWNVLRHCIKVKMLISDKNKGYEVPKILLEKALKKAIEKEKFGQKLCSTAFYCFNLTHKEYNSFIDISIPYEMNFNKYIGDNICLGFLLCAYHESECNPGDMAFIDSISDKINPKIISLFPSTGDSNEVEERVFEYLGTIDGRPTYLRTS